MDTSDPDVAFDDAGICNHCRIFDRAMTTILREPADRRFELERWVDRIRKAGRGRTYDCLIGLSGGADSSYATLQAKRLGLRPLVMHLDNGWNTECAVRNVERTLKALNFDLYTEVLEWDEFRDLQVAMLRASTPDSEIPTDHAILASVHKTAWKMNIPYIVTGSNRVTELVLPPAWSRGHSDWRYIHAVHTRFGTRPLKTFPHFDTVSYVRFRHWNEHRSVNLLELIDVSREEAILALQKEFGWTDYGGKHHESIYTRFFQTYILPRKFGYDKRRAHLSNEVLAGHITRETALREIAKPSSTALRAEQDREYVLKKLELTDEQFECIMRAPRKRYQDYPNMMNSPVYQRAKMLLHAARAALA
jgi:N-acetyl sugar amidotransferase